MNDKAFTLIEIIIVFVFIGVLAILALPRLNNQVIADLLKAAITTLGKYMRSIDHSYQTPESFAECDFEAKRQDFIDVKIFQYSLVAASPNISLTAQRAAYPSDTVTFTINTDSGIVSKTVAASGNYKGIKKKFN